MIALQSLIDPELVFPDLQAKDGVSALRLLSDRLAASLGWDDAPGLFAKLVERERLGSTGIGDRVAIPHCKSPGLDASVAAVGVFRQGVDFGSVDGQPTRLFVLLVSPENAPAEHLQALAAISKWLKVERHVDKILECRDRQEILDLLEEEGPSS